MGAVEAVRVAIEKYHDDVHHAAHAMNAMIQTIDQCTARLTGDADLGRSSDADLRASIGDLTQARQRITATRQAAIASCEPIREFAQRVLPP